MNKEIMFPHNVEVRCVRNYEKRASNLEIRLDALFFGGWGLSGDDGRNYKSG